MLSIRFFKNLTLKSKNQQKSQLQYREDYRKLQQNKNKQNLRRLIKKEIQDKLQVNKNRKLIPKLSKLVNNLVLKSSTNCLIRNIFKIKETQSEENHFKLNKFKFTIDYRSKPTII